MAFTKFTTDVENITPLDPLPNENDGLSDSELQALFDKAGVDIQNFINDTLISELEDTTTNQSGAMKIGAETLLGSDNVMDILKAIVAAGTGTVPPDTSITDAKLATDNKVGSLASLYTSAKTSIVAALNEIYSLPTTLVGTLADLTTTAKTNIVAAVNELVANNGYQTGDVKYTARTTAPTGWLNADGSAISRTTYANLFAAIGTTHGVGNGTTTFNIPDLRGVFVRGLDNGKGYDTGRAVGTYQADGNKTHTHTGTTDTENAAHTHIVNGTNAVSVYTGHQQYSNIDLIPSAQGGWSQGYPPVYMGTGTESANHGHAFTTASSGNSEVTVKNVALLAIIKI